MLGGGCFWCVEAVFTEIAGVTAFTSGYSGGHTVNPSYYEVCSEKTGHAEVVELEFDPSQITFSEILEVFFATHDPTTLNRQGADRGRTVPLGDSLHHRVPEGPGGELHKGVGCVRDRKRAGGYGGCPLRGILFGGKGTPAFLPEQPRQYVLPSSDQPQGCQGTAEVFFQASLVFTTTVYLAE